MKSIEERVNQWAVLPLSDTDRRNLMRMALIELADDLQAEKEKEVAELREKHHEYVNLSLAKQKEQSALLDEVKRVLAIVDHPETEGCGCDACRFVRARTQLLTRLGGSHE